MGGGRTGGFKPKTFHGDGMDSFFNDLLDLVL